MTLQTDEQTKQLFSAIRQTNGQTFVNPLAESTNSLIEQSDEAINFLESPDFSSYSTDELVESLQTLRLTLTSFLTHTNQLSGVPTDSPELFSFQSRVGILQSVIRINNSNIDPTLDKTNEEIVQSFFGTLSSAQENILTPVATVLDQILAIDVSVFVTPQEQQLLQDSLTSYQTEISNKNQEILNVIQMDNQSVQMELKRVSDFSVASTLRSQYVQDESLQQVYDLVLNPAIKQLL
jgi:hypothetical protein